MPVRYSKRVSEILEEADRPITANEIYAIIYDNPDRYQKKRIQKILWKMEQRGVARKTGFAFVKGLGPRPLWEKVR